jgi:hypothetical protein
VFKRFLSRGPVIISQNKNLIPTQHLPRKYGHYLEGVYILSTLTDIELFSEVTNIGNIQYRVFTNTPYRELFLTTVLLLVQINDTFTFTLILTYRAVHVRRCENCVDTNRYWLIIGVNVCCFGRCIYM